MKILNVNQVYKIKYQYADSSCKCDYLNSLASYDSKNRIFYKTPLVEGNS
jgi:hypothetical protein